MSAAEAARTPRCLARPTGGALLIGVLSWHHESSRLRRQSIRELCDTRHAAGVDMLFVLPDRQGLSPAPPPPSDTVHGDVLELPIAAAARQAVVGKLFLSNAWLRYAISCSTHHFIGRLDDDALINASHLSHLLRPFRDERYVVAGSHRHWYNWDAAAFYAVCWATTPNRARLSRLRWMRLMAELHPERVRALSAPRTPTYAIARAAPALARAENASDWLAASRTAAVNGTRRQALLQQGARLLHHDHCLRSAGPFPFAAGPFIAYSRPLATRLMGLQALADDEARIEAAYLQPEGAPRHILLEDVYYAYMLHTHLENASVVALKLTMVDYGTSFWASLSDTRRRHSYHIYHKLKHPRRFDFFRLENASLPNCTQSGDPSSSRKCAPWQPRDYLLKPPRTNVSVPTAKPRCGPLGDAMLKATGCCRSWRSCMPAGA